MNTLTDRDFASAAELLDCEVAAIRAVSDVESGRAGGFNPDGSPVTLFEGHIFHKQTGGRFDESHPDLSYPKWTKAHYGKGWKADQDRLGRAIALDHEAALKSASWGRFQIMGFNHRACGFDTVQSFVEAMRTGEREQLMAFCAFLKTEGIDKALRERDWTTFARRYNGPAFAENAYHTKIAAAYAKHATEPLVQLEQASYERLADSEMTITPTKGQPMAPFLLAALPALFDAVPKLVKSFTDDGVTVPQRNQQAIQIAVDVAKQALNVQTEQELAEAVKSDPQAAAAVRSAIDASWATITDAGGIPEARKADAEFVARGEPVYKSPSFMISIALLPVLYMVVGAVVGLFGQPFSDDVRSAIANGVVGLILGGISGYYWGSTTTRNRTTPQP